MKKCDLVMKGGITSGIVYPAALCELAREYRFVNIGGTSAGAIAAALTAAAEYRRQRGEQQGFDTLAALPDWLAEGDGGRLLSLFQPEKETAGVFEAAVAYLTHRGSVGRTALRALSVLLRRFRRWSSMALVPGVLVAAVCLAMAVRAESTVTVILSVAAALTVLVATAGVSAAAAVAEALVSFWRRLPAQHFGLCNGKGEGALTDWLDGRLRETAGVSHPLTFGDLRSCDIHLQMMTTSLTHGRPFQLPAETRRFFFSATEWRRFFPDDVVEAMIEAAPSRKRQRSPEGEELHPLPAPDALPVIVATRMSLSFPLLLAAVPLWSNDFARRDRKPVAERCWFSDGGMTSNFPVHFFDRPLPRWPTFAFNLADWSERYHHVDQRVAAPRTNMSGVLEWWTPIRDAADFALAIKNTMQNWRDNMLLHLPGQRDRIGHVLLRDDEGGLNLTMDAETIRRVAGKGREAAEDLRARFGDAPAPGVTLTWRNHRWVRFRSFTAALEDALESCIAAWDDEALTPSYEELLASGRLPSYRLSTAERARMHEAARAFFAHVRENFAGAPFRTPRRAPRPRPVLRAMPRE